MTSKQLKKLEADLEKRGYKKYAQCLTSKESWGWFKTFDKVKDKYGNAIGGYQIEFRVWDFSMFYRDNSEDAYGFDFWTSPIGTDGRIDCTANWEPVCDIGVFEQIARDFYSMTIAYFK